MVAVASKMVDAVSSNGRTYSALHKGATVGHTRMAPAVVHYKNMRFLILDKPSDATLDKFIRDLTDNDAKYVVRVCEPSYSITRLENAGFKVLDWPFNDGDPPPQEIIDDWFRLIRNTQSAAKDPPTIAIHCVAGLGRAPVLVALALMENGMKYEEAVEFIRQHRRGAINMKQLKYLEKYRPGKRLKTVPTSKKNCVIL